MTDATANSPILAGSLPAVRPEDSVHRYIAEVRKFPMLAADDEYVLACRWRDYGDVDAAHQLVTSHLRLVVKIALGYRGYGLPLGDLISEGNIGLMRAVKKFEPERGFRLATYAMWWIKAALSEYVLRSWSLVKVSTAAAQKRLFFSLRKVKARLSLLEAGDLPSEQVDQIANELNVSHDDVVSMNRRLNAPDSSLNTQVFDDDAVERQDLLVDEAPDQENYVAETEERHQRQALLADALEALNERERRIFTERRLAEEPVTLEELGARYGVSRERVRQIESRAYQKVERHVREAAAALPGTDQAEAEALAAE